jgi:hypothetical protein
VCEVVPDSSYFGYPNIGCWHTDGKVVANWDS